MNDFDIASAVSQIAQLRRAIDAYNDGLRALREDRYEQAEQLLLESGRLFEQLDRLDDASDCAERLGTLYAMQSRYEQAERALQAAIEHDRTRPERRKDLGLCLQTLANVCLLTDRARHGEELLAEAGAVFIMAGVPDRAAVCIENLAVALLFSEQCAPDEDDSRREALGRIATCLQSFDGWRAPLEHFSEYCRSHRSAAEAEAVAGVLGEGRSSEQGETARGADRERPAKRRGFFTR